MQRRDFLKTASLAPLALFDRLSLRSSQCLAADAGSRPRVAAIFTEFRFRSHAYDILENFFRPYLFNGELVDAGVDVVSFYADQFPDKEMSRDVSQRFGVPLFDSINDALCLGQDELAVDAVLSIGEHGDYPKSDLGQTMYPRKRFFDEAVAVMRRSDRFVPLFNDKHLSYRWDWAKEMYDTSRQCGFPLMAGSSVPLAQRNPAWELPKDAKIKEAVAIHGGGIESYDFHGLEVLQSFVENRLGGETGVARVELLTGDAFAAARAEGRWSSSLVDAAIDAEAAISHDRQPWPVEAGRTPPRRDAKSSQSSNNQPLPRPVPEHALVVTYKDGLKATVLKVGNSGSRWGFACRMQGEDEPRATALYNGPWGNRGLFKALSHAIQHLFVHQEEPYPVERTLLVTGILEAAMKSHADEGRPVDTPHLDISYHPTETGPFREMGQTWKHITMETPQPFVFTPGDRDYFRAE